MNESAQLKGRLAIDVLTLRICMSLTALLLTGEQIRAGRAFLRLEQAELDLLAARKLQAPCPVARELPCHAVWNCQQAVEKAQAHGGQELGDDKTDQGPGKQRGHKHQNKTGGVAHRLSGTGHRQPGGHIGRKPLRQYKGCNPACQRYHFHYQPAPGTYQQGNQQDGQANPIQRR